MPGCDHQRRRLSRVQVASELRPVGPYEILPYWALIREGLEKVRESSGDGWIAEDIYAALRQGSSQLYVGFDNGAYAGFLVLTAVQGYHDRRCHIWCAYSNDPHRDAIAAFMPQLEHLAQVMNARKITLCSPRRFDRRLAPLGFNATQTTYEKEL